MINTLKREEEENKTNRKNYHDSYALDKREQNNSDNKISKTKIANSKW